MVPAIVCVALVPHTVDLAAHTYRSGLFGREGFTIWDGGWYGGHHTPAYSVLFPPLGWLLGPTLAGALAAVAAAALFVPLARTPLAAAWFGLGVGAQLFTGRMPFLLGVAVGLAALVALRAGRTALAAALAVVCSLASPVAGAFLALAGISLRTRAALATAAAALVPIALLSIAFPEGGYEPFAFSSYVAIPLASIAALALLERSEHALRLGAVLYALAGTAAYVIHTPMGGNAVRLGSLFAGPLLAGARLRGPRAVIVLVFAALAWWQLQPPVRDTIKAYEDPSTQASYYAPLNAELARLHAGAGGTRVEVPFTRGHWEAAEVAQHVPLARGWERQLDIARNPIFYGRAPLNAQTYAHWLSDNAVGWVALADSKPDYSSVREHALIEAGLPYLRSVWSSHHWRVYAVALPHPLAGSARVTHAGNASLTLVPRDLRPLVVKVAWSPYWRARGGCVEQAGPWTRLVPRRTGPQTLSMAFSLARVLDRGPRCG